ncbi:MAG TPA: aldo/keto reductase [Rhizomicrobium sp.]|nr:aldo/keto reductase [Rhizomicrobium sp.]
MTAGPARAQDPGTSAASNPRTVKFPDGRIVPALGQGTWHLGEGRHPLLVEEAALRTGVALGMTVIDTSGNYEDGGSEQFLGNVFAGQRERIFLVSKAEADPVFVDGPDSVVQACEASLKRLRTDYLDLYLLHSPVSSDLISGVVAKFEQLRAAGKIRAWGVSNFTVDQMEELFRVPDGHRCATNQIRYSLRYPYADHDMLPWCAAHNMPVMAYSPLGSDNNLLVNDRALAKIAAAHGCTAAAVALAWVMRGGNVLAIPESGSPAHVRENAVALSIRWLPASP